MPVSAIAGLVGDEAETFVVATHYFIHLLFQAIILLMHLDINKLIIVISV